MAEKIYIYQLIYRKLQDGDDLAELERDVWTKIQLAYPDAAKIFKSLMPP